ncbi:unnamed protein product [Discosporangium mesarthrocarpum]
MEDLQTHCKRLIDLQLQLDQERMRADRLEREKKEDEALSSELASIMEGVGENEDTSAKDNLVNASVKEPSESTGAGGVESFDEDNEDTSEKDNFINTSVEEPSESTGAGGEQGREQYEGRGKMERAFLSLLGGFYGRGAQPKDHEGREDIGKRVDTQGDKGPEEHGGSSPQREMALRARVVELELGRQEALEALKAKADESLRLAVQVEQLKNVFEVLTNASSREQAIPTPMSTTPRDGSDLCDFKETPEVDPEVMLQLYRKPWSEGVAQGIRRVEEVYETGGWSANPHALPPDLRSLVHRATQQPRPKHKSNTYAMHPMPAKPARVAQTHSSTSNMSSASHDSRPPISTAAAVVGGSLTRVKDHIGGIVTDLKGLRGSLPSVLTNRSRDRELSLDGVSLPSHHWEWIGGWMVDTEAPGSESDGWVEGTSTDAILEQISGKASNLGRDWNKHAKPRLGSAQGFGFAREYIAIETRPKANPNPDPNPNPGSQQAERPVLPDQKGTRSSPSHNPSQEVGVKAVGMKGHAHPNLEQEGTEEAGAGKWSRGEKEGSGGEREGSGRKTGGGIVQRELRCRRLVRLRMLTRVDGANESTTCFLKMLHKMSSMEVLVRKLSDQVVSLQSEVTLREGQVAYLSPMEAQLRHKLGQVCAMGRRDKHRGDVLQQRLTETQNELKVLKRCVGPAFGIGTPRAAAQSVAANTLVQPGIDAADDTGNTGSTADTKGAEEASFRDQRGQEVSASREQMDKAGEDTAKVGGAWSWMGHVVQRRRHRSLGAMNEGGRHEGGKEEAAPDPSDHQTITHSRVLTNAGIHGSASSNNGGQCS